MRQFVLDEIPIDQLGSKTCLRFPVLRSLRLDHHNDRFDSSLGCARDRDEYVRSLSSLAAGGSWDYSSTQLQLAASGHTISLCVSSDSRADLVGYPLFQLRCWWLTAWRVPQVLHLSRSAMLELALVLCYGFDDELQQIICGSKEVSRGVGQHLSDDLGSEGRPPREVRPSLRLCSRSSEPGILAPEATLQVSQRCSGFLRARFREVIEQLSSKTDC